MSSYNAMTQAGQSFLKQQLSMHGSAAVVESLNDRFHLWVVDAVAAKDFSEFDVSMELPSHQTQDGNPYVIRFSKQHFATYEEMVF